MNENSNNNRIDTLKLTDHTKEIDVETCVSHNFLNKVSANPNSMLYSLMY